jgi:AcrR family transcriptional regulator
MQATQQIESMRSRLPAAERREVILDAALSVFAVHGYETASMGEISAAAGVSKPVLYDHFASKQDMYVSLLTREAARMSVALNSSFDPAAPLEQRLRTLALNSIGFARRNAASSQLLFQPPIGDTKVRQAHERVRKGGRQAIADAILADPVFTASPGLTRKASALLLGDLHSAVLERLVRWAIEDRAVSARALSEVFVDVLWTGLGADG